MLPCLSWTVKFGSELVRKSWEGLACYCVLVHRPMLTPDWPTNRKISTFSCVIKCCCWYAFCSEQRSGSQLRCHKIADWNFQVQYSATFKTVPNSNPQNKLHDNDAVQEQLHNIMLRNYGYDTIRLMFTVHSEADMKVTLPNLPQVPEMENKQEKKGNKKMK